MDEFRQLSIRNIVVSIWSKFPLKGTVLWYQLDRFFISAIGLQMSIWSEGCFIVASWQSQHLSVKKNKKYEKIRSSKLSLIRPKCARRGYDPTPMRSKSPLIRLFRPKLPLIRPSPDHLQTVVCSNFRPDLVILVWEHTGVRSTGSDYKPIWVWTSTWVAIRISFPAFKLYYCCYDQKVVPIWFQKLKNKTAAFFCFFVINSPR